MVLHRITGKVPNCSDNMIAQNQRVSYITGSLWVVGPNTNPLAPLLRHSIHSPAQGTADRSWHLTGVRRATMVLHGGNVQELAQVVEEQEGNFVSLRHSFTRLWSSSSPARSPGIPLEITSLFHPAEDFKKLLQPWSPEGVHKGKKSNPKGGGWKRSNHDEKNEEKMPESWCNRPLSKHPVTRDELSQRWAAELPLLTKTIWVKYLWCRLLLSTSFLARFSTWNLNRTKAESPPI